MIIQQLIDSNVIHLSALGTHLVILNSHESAIDLLEKRSAVYSDRVRRYRQSFLVFHLTRCDQPHLPMLVDLYGLFLTRLSLDLKIVSQSRPGLVISHYPIW